MDKDTSKFRFKHDYPHVQPYYMKPELLTFGVTEADIQIRWRQYLKRAKLPEQTPLRH